MKLILSLVFLAWGSMANAAVAPSSQKLHYAQSALAAVLSGQGYLLISDTVRIRRSLSPAQIPLQMVNLFEALIPAGRDGAGGQGSADLDVVYFQAWSEDNRLYKGWVYLFSTMAAGCQNSCRHQLEEPTAEKVISASSRQEVYFRLYNFNFPRTIHDIDLHLREGDGWGDALIAPIPLNLE